jgi:hypothetical protein
MNNIRTQKRTFARLTGYSLIAMALAAGFSFGYVFPKIFNESQLDLAQTNIAQNIKLYNWMLIGLVIVLLLDILVSYTFYKYFKNDNKKLALLSSIFRILYSLLFGIAIIYLSKNIGQNNNATVITHYNLFQLIWFIGLIVFGFHLLMVGILMKLHKLIPRIMWYLMLIAGVSYILIHVLKIVFPELSEFSNLLNMILGLPMALAELSLAVWLIARGGKIKKI